MKATAIVAGGLLLPSASGFQLGGLPTRATASAPVAARMMFGGGGDGKEGEEGGFM